MKNTKRAGALLGLLAVPFLSTVFSNAATASADDRPIPPGTQQFLDTIGLNPNDYRGHGGADNSVPCAKYADSYAAVDSIPGGMCPG